MLLSLDLVCMSEHFKANIFLQDIQSTRAFVRGGTHFRQNVASSRIWEACTIRTVVQLALFCLEFRLLSASVITSTCDQNLSYTSPYVLVV